MREFIRTLALVVLGLTLGILMTFFAGESPLHVLTVLAKSAFGSSYDFGMTLFYTTPLIFTGLAVAIPYRAGLFNIGAEGQLTLGALAAAAVGCVFVDLPWPFAPALAVIVAFGVGAFWAAISGWLRAARGSHEVITTIMLNFVAIGFASWVTLYLLPNPDSQNPETRTIGAGYMIWAWTPLILACVVALLMHLMIKKTVWGFEMRAVGANESAARVAGISISRVRVMAMAWGGGLAGLVGVSEVLGHSARFKLGFSPDFGFTGIAVALLARGHPLGILLTALLFGALHKGASDLDLETDKVTRDLSAILQAVVILVVAARGWRRRR